MHDLLRRHGKAGDLVSNKQALLTEPEDMTEKAEREKFHAEHEKARVDRLAVLLRKLEMEPEGK